MKPNFNVITIEARHKKKKKKIPLEKLVPFMVLENLLT